MTDVDTSEQLTKLELDQLAFMEAAECLGKLAALEAQQTADNYGGSLLEGSIPFGD
jgi:hypothetical protein